MCFVFVDASLNRYILPQTRLQDVPKLQVDVHSSDHEGREQQHPVPRGSGTRLWKGVRTALYGNEWELSANDSESTIRQRDFDQRPQVAREGRTGRAADTLALPSERFVIRTRGRKMK